MSLNSRYDRERLYKEVWASPTRDVAKSYGVSGVALAKTCRLLGVPLPGRGHWAKVAAGHSVERPPLPPAEPVETSPVQSVPARQSRSATSTAADSSEESAIGAARREDPLLVTTRAALESCLPSRGPLLRPYKRLVADIYVSADQKERALQFAGKLFRALRRAGFRVGIAAAGPRYERPTLDSAHRGGGPHSWDDEVWSPGRPTVAWKSDALLGIAIYETLEYVDAAHRDGKYVRVDPSIPKRRRRGYVEEWITKHNFPSGRLGLLAYSALGYTDWTQVWTEAPGADLADSVAGIASNLLASAPRLAADIAVKLKEHRAQQEAWAAERREMEAARIEAERREARRRAEAERQRLIDASRTQLRSIVDAWEFAKRASAFFESAERRLATMPDGERASWEKTLGDARQLIADRDPIDRLRAWTPPPHD